jgi:hypothetical protein
MQAFSARAHILRPIISSDIHYIRPCERDYHPCRARCGSVVRAFGKREVQSMWTLCKQQNLNLTAPELVHPISVELLGA